MCWTIAAALEALGFIVMTKRGQLAYADIPGRASEFRLTYKPGDGTNPTNEWEQITTLDQAKNIANAARQDKSRAHVMRSRQALKNKIPGAVSAPAARCRNGTYLRSIPGAETAPTVPDAETAPTSISRVRAQRQRGPDDLIALPPFWTAPILVEVRGDRTAS
jgi:hypothetical protein